MLDIKKIKPFYREDSKEITLTFDNLPKNMGITLGNYLRRFLLDYTPSIALIGIKLINEEDNFSTIKTQFSVYPGINIVVPHFIQKLKEIILIRKNKKNENEELRKIFSFTLKVYNETEEEMKIYAKNLELNDDFELENPDLYLATLSSKKALHVVTFWSEGQGYYTSDKQKKLFKETMDINEYNENEIIFLDTNYSPFPITFSLVKYEVKKVITGAGVEDFFERMILSISKSSDKNNINHFNFKNIISETLLSSRDIFSHLLSEINADYNESK